MSDTSFLNRIQQHPNTVQFKDSIEFIDHNYIFTPGKFVNGKQLNEAGQNNGSCKIFAFGLINELTEQQTLACFGEYYRNDVLKKPDADDHQNIRQFMLWHKIL